jgi:hypothetical protein
LDSAKGPSETIRPFLPGNGRTGALECVAGFSFALRDQSFNPSVVLTDHFLDLVVRELFIPTIAAEKQHVTVLLLRIHSLHSVFRSCQFLLFRNTTN